MTEHDDRIRQMEQQILGEIWLSDESYRNLAYLCDDLEHRFAGSDREHAAAHFLREKLESYGLENVWLEEFPMASWERGACRLRMTAPLSREFSAIALPYCPSAVIEADIIDVGEGEESDFKRLGALIVDKIVLTDAETNRPGEHKSHRNDKYAWAVERGARAIIYINQNPGLLRITGSITGRVPGGASAAEREAPIPGIGISYEAGRAIRRLGRRGTPRLKIETTNRTFDSVSYNVLAEITGQDKPHEVILIGGHYDGHDVSQGAGDDGAGTITGVEAGRALATLKGRLSRTVRVICFGAEEVGLLGAWHHAARSAASGSKEQLRFVLNLDGAGRGAGGQEAIEVSSLPEIAQYFEALGTEMNYAFEVQDHLSTHSDHFPFAVRGIPNATLKSKDSTAGMVGRGWGHTEADTFDKLSLRGLQMAAVLTARIALRLSEDESFPGRSRSVDEVRQQLDDAGTLAQQERAGRFPPR